MVLFLDFDGVLHPAVCYDRSRLFCRRPLLESVLRKCPSVEVVISSTWRFDRTLADLRELFASDIQDRIVGMTGRWQEIQDEASSATYVRQAEVEHWMRASSRASKSWLALDDQPYLFRPFCENLIRTDPDVGLSEEGTAALLARLTS